MTEAIALHTHHWRCLAGQDDYQLLISRHRQVDSCIESHCFRPGFQLLRQHLRTHVPLWHPPFADTGYIGLCFAFSAAPATSIALGHLYHRAMNMTNGYAFAGGIHHAIEQPVDYVSLRFSRPYLEELAERHPLPRWLRGLLAPAGIIDRIAVPVRLRELAWQICALPPARTLSARLRLEALALDWLAGALELRPSGPLQHARIDDARAIIASEYAEPLTISRLAQRIGVNECTLKQQFKAQTGETINACLTRTRLAAARRQLTERPDLPVKLIATASGYDPRYFSTLFRKHHGMTPQAWRQAQSRSAKRSIPDE